MASTDSRVPDHVTVRESYLRIALQGILVTLAAAILTYSIVETIQLITFSPGPFVDWRTYVNATDRLLAGQPIYAAQQLSGPYQLTDMVLIGYAYPPSSVPLFLVFHDYPLGLAAWMTFNLGLLLTALWAMVSRAWPRLRLVAFAAAIIGLAHYPPFLDGVIAGNPNVGLAGAIGWVSVGIGERAAGLIGGGGAILKVFAGVLAVATPGSKVRSIVWAVGLVFSVTILTLPLVGLGSWFDFATAMTNAVPDCYPLNWSIACVLSPWMDPRAGALVGVGVGAIAALGLLLARHPYHLSILAAIAVMAPAHNLHLHYWTIAYVLLVASFARLSELGARRRQLGHRRSAAV